MQASLAWKCPQCHTIWSPYQNKCLNCPQGKDEESYKGYRIFKVEDEKNERVGDACCRLKTSEPCCNRNKFECCNIKWGPCKHGN